MLRHGHGSDYGRDAYTLHTHGRGACVIIQAGLTPREARMVEAAPEMLVALEALTAGVNYHEQARKILRRIK